MARKIVIESCKTCPHRDHMGAFGSPAYVPVCRRMNQQLPYDLQPNGRGTGCIAVPSYDIPDCCPLERDEQ